jgi:hypothetical protein
VKPLITTIQTKYGTIMVGRKRKNLKREPSGRPSRAYENPKLQVMMQPHRRDIPDKLKDGPEAESSFGRLMCLGIITPAQHEAGKRYRQISFDYREVYHNAPSPHPKAISLLLVSGGGGDGAEPHRETLLWIKRVYDAAFEALGEAGNRAQRAVKDHAVFEKPCPDEFSRALLRRGLDRLVEHYGIDPRLKIERMQ